jgi:serine/threonine kinase 16
MGAFFTLLFTPSSKILKITGRTLIIKRKIGEGGYSYVYLSYNPYSGEEFAAKQTLCQTEESLAAAKKEIEIMQRHHDNPNLLHLLAYEIRPSRTVPNATDVITLVPYYRKGTLQDTIDEIRNKKRTPFTEQQILRIFLGICNGIRALHEHEPPQAHNDIKPSNILLDEKDDKPAVMDFGSVSNARHVITGRHEALRLQEFAQANCTPLYKAPELFDIASDITIDERTDIWSLGCTLYAMAFLKNPFQDQAETGSIALAVASGKIEFPQESRFSQPFMDLIKATVQSDPQSRPTIQELIQMVQKMTGKQNDTGFQQV